jgi:glycosyltransferase involved in cell wall biosynthesis
MPKFAAMLTDGMRARGHTVEILSAKPYFFRLPLMRKLRKWMGYIDQYLIFPIVVRIHVMRYSRDTLFVFSDQALGPWVPLVAKSPHVIHCHDFLAQQSALGDIPENKSGWTGRQYQAFIRRGFRTGKNFISVSQNTRKELHKFLNTPPLRSDIVYNGLNQSFNPGDAAAARIWLTKKSGIELTGGYLLHIGGNQWYKNRRGVLEIYDALRSTYGTNLPVLFVGKNPTKELLEMYNSSGFKDDIHWLSNMDDEAVKMAYLGATVFLFPSLAEGFGWPIAEAMASGCPVITTDETPMTEVAGDAAFLLPKRPFDESKVKDWAAKGAAITHKVIQLPAEERCKVVLDGIKNAKRFDTKSSLDQIEEIYCSILQSYNTK